MAKVPIRNNLIIELHVPDFDVVKRFYSVLGFNTILEHSVVGGEPGYLVMQRHDEIGDSILNFYGGCEKMYNQSYFKQFPKNTKRGYGTEVTIPVARVDELFMHVKLVLPEFIKQVVQNKKDNEMVWRDFRMEDPFGFYLRFTELIDWGQ